MEQKNIQIKNDYSKLDLSTQLEIFINYSKLENDFFDRSAYGLLFKTGSKEAFYIQRVQYEIQDTFELFLLGLQKILDFVDDFKNLYDLESIKVFVNDNEVFYKFKTQKLLSLNFQEILNKIIIKIHHLKLLGLHIDLQTTSYISKKFENLLDDALKNYKCINDFESQIRVFSVMNSRLFDTLISESLLEKLKLIQIVDDYSFKSTIETPIKNYEKWFLTSGDYIQFNDLLSSIQTVGESYPFSQDQKNFFLRRMAFCLSESNCGLMFSSFQDEHNLSYPDDWFFEIAQILQKEILIYNQNNDYWYKPSKDSDGKRVLILTKKFKISQYRNLTLYSNHSVIKDAFQNWKKLIKRNYK